MIRLAKSSAILVALCLAALIPVSASAQTPTTLATGKPTVFKVTVTKVELFNGTSFVTVFSGSSQLDLVAAAGTTAFPGISTVTLATGTYTQARVTFSNSFTMRGSLASSGTTYYTTATTLSGDQASQATTVAGSAAEATVLNPSWGALGAAVVQTFTIPSVTITSGTNYGPTMKFDVTNSLVLATLSGVFYFNLAEPTITIQ